jgi:MoaA/NifB/PqqE/SkfB family radical SAM enzyme
MANIGYIQLVRHCNHYCGFCSNPKSGYHTNLDEIRAKLDDLVARGFFGVILTGGEPTLSPDLPEAIAYARSVGLHVRMISNGWRLAEPAFCREVVDAGLHHVHISVYSTRPEVEQYLRGVPRPLPRTYEALANLGEHGARVTVNVNSVINRYNADHLHESVRTLCERFPFIRHFIWNNLDPGMGRATINKDHFTHRLCDMEWSLKQAMDYLTASGRTFRVWRVPLCFMTEYAHCSTDTRNIIKDEERIIHFLDEKGTIHRSGTGFEHLYGEACGRCMLRPVCGGLHDRGNGYDTAELYPVFADPMDVVQAVLDDFASDPSWTPARRAERVAFWRDVTARWRAAVAASPSALAPPQPTSSPASTG